MGLKLSSTRADLDREAAGDWIAYPEWPGVAFKVSSLHAPAYVAARDEAVSKLAREFGQNPPPRERLAELNGDIYCRHILHGWRGIVEDDGSDIAFTREKAREILCDPAYREVLTAVEWCAREAGRIRVAYVKEREKNSVRPSDGNASRKASSG